jgi:hypothetical protein
MGGVVSSEIVELESIKIEDSAAISAITIIQDSLYNDFIVSQFYYSDKKSENEETKLIIYYDQYRKRLERDFPGYLTILSYTSGSDKSVIRKNKIHFIDDETLYELNINSLSIVSISDFSRNVEFEIIRRIY